MAAVDLNKLCIHLRNGQQLCLNIAGAELCASVAIELGDPGQTLRAFLGQINAALTPLTPFFDVLDVLVKIVECVKAVPDAITSVPPDPTKLTKCIPGLLQALEKLLGLLPQVWVPKLVKEILLIVIAGLIELRDDLESMLDFRDDLAAAHLVIALPGNLVLGTIFDCEQDNFNVTMQNLNASTGPLSRLLGLVALLLQLAQSPVQIPAISDLGADPAKALAPLDAVINAMRAAANAIPVP